MTLHNVCQLEKESFPHIFCSNSKFYGTPELQDKASDMLISFPSN